MKESAGHRLAGCRSFGVATRAFPGGPFAMPRLSDAQIAGYLRLHPLPTLGAPLTIRPLEADSGMARFQVSGAPGPCVLTCYQPSEAQTARRALPALTLAPLPHTPP